MNEHTGTNSRFLRFLWLIPVLVLGYIIWMNILPLGGTLTFFSEEGEKNTNGAIKNIGPFNRILGEDNKEINSTSFIELEESKVYFELDVQRLRKNDEVEVRLRFKDNFPSNAKFILGAQNEEGWSYYHIYSPFLSQLRDSPVVAKTGNVTVYATEKESSVRFESVDEFQRSPPLGSVIALNDNAFEINQRLSLKQNEEMDALEFNTRDVLFIQLTSDIDKNGWYKTDVNLRQTHILYFFASSDSTRLKITKRDMNSYEGEDMLDVLIYSLDGTLKATATIPDDGDATASRNLGAPQDLALIVDNLERGTYQLILKTASASNDLIVTQIRVNQTKVVIQGRVFLAGNPYPDLRPQTIWCYLSNESELRFRTLHDVALQAITISGQDYNQIINMDTVNQNFSTGLLKPGIYQIIVEKTDVIIDAPKGYFSFIKDSLFIPTSTPDPGENDTLVVNITLKGRHTFWTYVSDDTLDLNVTKQDLNWIENPDELVIEVYSFGGELKGSTTIQDDGNESKGNGLGPPQSGSLRIEDLEPGAYRIELKGNPDVLIRKIELNQEKLVSKKVYLVGMNPAYFTNGLAFDPVRLYSKNFKADEIHFLTFYKSGLQQINIQGDDFTTEIDVNELNIDINTTLEPGEYRLFVPKQAIIITSDGYLSFTPESFFLPKRCEIVELKYDLQYVRENVDYVIINYNDLFSLEEDHGWIVAQASWKGEDLFIKDGKLRFYLSAPHLDEEPGRAIPIDWVEITVKTPPIWERLRSLD